MRLIISGLFIFLLSCGSNSEMNSNTEMEVIKVACAANMQYAMDSIVVLFEKTTGIKCDITSGSSGMLTSQIENGAPYDVFFSANMKYPTTLFTEKKGEEPIIYAKGRLLLVVNKNSTYNSIEEVLIDEQIKRIAIADKHTAPYGMAAMQYLNNTGEKESIKERLVIGESIGQVNQYITTNAVDAGFTSYSFKVKNKSIYRYFEVEQELFDPINQGVIILNHGRNNAPKASEKFIQFFDTAECKAVLNYFGYLTE